MHAVSSFGEKAETTMISDTNSDETGRLGLPSVLVALLLRPGLCHKPEEASFKDFRSLRGEFDIAEIAAMGWSFSVDLSRAVRYSV